MMAQAGPDPRTASPPTGSGPDLRPLVANRSAGLPWWILAGGMVLAAILLFSVLDARRRAATAPATKPRRADMVGLAAPVPQLYIPPLPTIVERPNPVAAPVVLLPIPPPAPVALRPRTIYVPQLAQPSPPPIAGPSSAPKTVIDPALVYDGSTGLPGTSVGESSSAQPSADAATAAAMPGARASVIRHLSTLVPQGSLIPAVLETALDSTRAGPARALVTRDVRGFDGGRILIPRGSRLVGDYRADLEPGQNRALVTWTRLIRPDGVTIAIGSPAGDPLGRVGVRGRVDSHFLERFGAALLQSALQIGVARASQIGGSAVVVALPGTVQTVASPLTGGTPPRPTLRVRQGTTITVLVARDLDFTAVEARK